MKRIFTFLSLLIVLTSFTVLSGLDEVVSAMKTGNFTTVSKYFDKNVEISMPDKTNSYSKSQAALVLKDFFTTNSVSGFDIIHKGESGGSQYCIGTLKSKNGQYRTTIFMKQKADGQVLQELRFENR
ncbi:MAG: DUF4783 domain-containing protein [Bacteroidota bacterium]